MRFNQSDHSFYLPYFMTIFFWVSKPWGGSRILWRGVRGGVHRFPERYFWAKVNVQIGIFHTNGWAKGIRHRSQWIKVIKEQLLTLSLPRVINFTFLFQSLTRDISYNMENLVIDSLLRWKLIELSFLTTLLNHFLLEWFRRICIMSLGLKGLNLF